MLRYSYYSFVIMGTVQSGGANEKRREGKGKETLCNLYPGYFKTDLRPSPRSAETRSSIIFSGGDENVLVMAAARYHREYPELISGCLHKPLS